MHCHHIPSKVYRNAQDTSQGMDRDPIWIGIYMRQSVPQQVQSELPNNSHYIDILGQLKHHTFMITMANDSVSLVCCSCNLESFRNRLAA